MLCPLPLEVTGLSGSWGMKDDLPVVYEFSDYRPSLGLCTSSDCPSPVRLCVWRRWRRQHRTPATVRDNYIGQHFMHFGQCTDRPNQPVFGEGLGDGKL